MNGMDPIIYFMWALIVFALLVGLFLWFDTKTPKRML